MSYWK